MSEQNQQVRINTRVKRSVYEAFIRYLKENGNLSIYSYLRQVVCCRAAEQLRKERESEAGIGS